MERERERERESSSFTPAAHKILFHWFCRQIGLSVHSYRLVARFPKADTESTAQNGSWSGEAVRKGRSALCCVDGVDPLDPGRNLAFGEKAQALHSGQSGLKDM